MALDMFGQMIRPHESPLTNVTNELLFARVSSAMSTQFVGSTELSLASIPSACKRLFSCMSSYVRFQVRTLVIRFLTVFILTAISAATFVQIVSWV
jgi:hypothetical protein